jgi:hypothetical protein
MQMEGAARWRRRIDGASTSCPLLRAAIALVATLPLTTPTVASEGGSTHYLPGTSATLIDLAPTQPGWIAEFIYTEYSGDAGASRTLPVGGLLASGLDVDVSAVSLGVLRTLEPRVLGGRYTFGAFLQHVSVDATASVSGPAGTVRRRDTESGLGDVTLVPLMLAWESGYWQYNVAIPVIAPTGEYRAGRLANPGLNYWTIDPTFSVSFNHDTKGFNAAVFAGLAFNTENDATDYRSGTLAHVEASLQQLLPLGHGFAGIGVQGFWLEQVSGDSGSGARLGDFKGSTRGLGPVLTYFRPTGATSAWVAELRWLKETDSTRRLEGEYVWLKVVYDF